MSYESSTSSALPDGETRTNLIINYLPQTLTDQEFYKIFVVVGPIKNCRIMKDLKQTGYSFGFGFVEYQKPEDAAKAILQLNNLPVQHKRIKVSYARPPGEDIKETNLYIQNIPRSYTLDQLEELFAVYGQIVQKNLLKDKVTGLPRGVGFVRFDKKSQAEAAIVGMNGVVPEGGTEPLVVKVAEEHGKMKAAYYAGYHAGLSNTRGGTSGRGRGNYNNRGAAGYQGRGNYNNMAWPAWILKPHQVYGQGTETSIVNKVRECSVVGFQTSIVPQENLKTTSPLLLFSSKRRRYINGATTEHAIEKNFPNQEQRKFCPV
ncbi:sex-lethal homolog isoform X5 [Homarus americanus]|uniref:sex-lethal homolog isoform X5 n=1 Tax=Homarus americanus TaxID=6706 RepID=UPI001C48C00A|nr:sex-lethal homolog isoform X5 [Homarus americanus]